MDEEEERRARRVEVRGRAAFKGGFADRGLPTGVMSWVVVVSRQSGELLRRRRPYSSRVRCFFKGGGRPLFPD